MYFIRIRGKVNHTLTITEKQIIVSIGLKNYSNIIFPKNHISVLFDTHKIASNLDQALEFIEQKMHKEIELNIRFPKMSLVYFGSLHTI